MGSLADPTALILLLGASLVWTAAVTPAVAVALDEGPCRSAPPPTLHAALLVTRGWYGTLEGTNTVAGAAGLSNTAGLWGAAKDQEGR